MQHQTVRTVAGRRIRSARRPGAFGLAAAGVLLLASCGAGVRLESAQDVEAPLDARALAALADSSAGTRLAPVSRTPPRAAAPTAGVTAPVATPLELAELSAALGIPVQGVTPAQLRDSFAEPRGGRSHEAIDILVPRGTPVLSAADGRVLRLFDSRAGGLMVYATDTSERFILLYGHLDGYAPGLADGMVLKRGQVIGYVGTTGNAPEDNPHLHFGILRGRPHLSWSKGFAVNPYPLLVR